MAGVPLTELIVSVVGENRQILNALKEVEAAKEKALATGDDSGLQREMKQLGSSVQNAIATSSRSPALPSSGGEGLERNSSLICGDDKASKLRAGGANENEADLKFSRSLVGLVGMSARWRR